MVDVISTDALGSADFWVTPVEKATYVVMSTRIQKFLEKLEQ